MPLDVPVAFMVFNRPDTTRRVFTRIREARPARLLVIADGPRPGRPGEAERCREALSIATTVDWDCTLEVLASPTNLGCRHRVSSGLDWVFSQVERAIVLEDDCLPDPSFFPFCAELLERYANDPRVMAISGDRFHASTSRESSYSFSRYNHVWGWASWRRAWSHYDVDVNAWPRARSERVLERTLERPSVARYFRRKFDQVAARKIDTWDYQWTLACWLESGLTVLPSVNLVSNIGFGANATHTTGSSRLANLPTSPIAFPLRHPLGVTRDAASDRRTEDLVFLSRPIVRSMAYLIDLTHALGLWGDR